ncbi:hypothetical protein [Alistipes sp. ZOR0009]|uniref:hypothetical protein n=1 Tax=Alistipes sp. ZOR0009 TaxID=1339253 RepID=UPI0006473640|nr:hypothetical protein [Alistipes sp. ZOR0009]
MDTFEIGISKIKDIEFLVDESIAVSSPDAISINFEVNLNVNAELKMLDLVLTVKYLYNGEQNFLKIKTSNVFLVPSFDQLGKDDNGDLLLPDGLLVTMLSLSISHTRALLAKNSLGTKFSDYYLPIVNPAELAADLFGIKQQ